MQKLYNAANYANYYFTLTGKARQTFANFSSNVRPNLTKI
jgi:hypothetical protein